MMQTRDSKLDPRALRGGPLTALCLAVICGATVWSMFRLDPFHLFGQAHDDAIMMSTAQALAEGKGYIMPNVPESPQQTRYPVLYPWLLSLIWSYNPSFPSNLTQALGMSAAFACLALLASYFLLRSLGLTRWLAVGITAFCGLNPFFLFHASRVMTDVPMMAFMMTIAILAQRAVQQERGYRLMALAGLLTGTTVLMRSLGFTILVAVVVVALYHKRYRAAVVFLSTSVPLIVAGALLQGDNHALAPWVEQAGAGFRQTWLYYTSYLGFWKLHAADLEVLKWMVWKNLFLSVVAIGNYFVIVRLHVPLLTDALGPLPHNAIVVTLGVGILMGVVRHARRGGWKVIHWIYLLHAGAIIPWTHGNLMDRFALPFLPLFCLGAWTEAHHIGGAISASFRRGKPALERAGAVALTVIMSLFVLRNAEAYIYYSRVNLEDLTKGRVAIQKEKYELYEWIRNHTSKSARIVAPDDSDLYLRAGRQAMLPIVFSQELYYAEREEALQRDLDHILDTARHIRARYWVRSEDEFFWYGRRKDYSRQMDLLLEDLPVVFRSSGGKVRLYDVSALVIGDDARGTAGKGGG